MIDGSPTEHPVTARQGTGRVVAVDLVRGLAMVVMVLDHARDFVHHEAFLFDPTDLGATTAPIFMTRWITHFVAPIFVLLAGVSARLQLDRGRSRRELARFLAVRGIWLIVLEFTVVRAGIFLNVDPSFLGLLQIIWAIGVSMMVLAVLVFLPDAAIAVVGLVLVVGHNALDRFVAPEPLTGAWAVLHERASITIGGAPDPNLIVLYPLVPWIGVLALGYVLGRVYRWEDRIRQRVLIGLGVGLTLAWIALRASNLYGDPEPFRPSGDAVLTAMSFLDAEKYPPSLIFLLMTLGPTSILLGFLERVRVPRSMAWLAVFGTVPLFFYLLQWFAVHGLAVAMEAVAGRSIEWHFATPPGRFAMTPSDAGFPLPVVYLTWIAVIATLYVPCRAYARLRAERGGWLRYL